MAISIPPRYGGVPAQTAAGASSARFTSRP
jgi:hypothetical protein